jgi:porphobilinogen deaminase
MARPVTIGTRGSRLALWQAEWVRAQIERVKESAADKTPLAIAAA